MGQLMRSICSRFVLLSWYFVSLEEIPIAKGKKFNREIPQQHEIWLSICTKYLTVYLGFWFEKEEEEERRGRRRRRRKRRGRRRHIMSMSKRKNLKHVKHCYPWAMSTSLPLSPRLWHDTQWIHIAFFVWLGFFSYFEVVSHIAHADFERAA